MQLSYRYTEGILRVPTANFALVTRKVGNSGSWILQFLYRAHLMYIYTITEKKLETVHEKLGEYTFQL